MATKKDSKSKNNNPTSKGKGKKSMSGTENKSTGSDQKNNKKKPVNEEQVLGFDYEKGTLLFDSIEEHDEFSNSRQSYPDVEGLADSILEHGLLTPLTVWEKDCAKEVVMPWGKVKKRYFIIAGFRRRQAIKLVQCDHPEYLKEVPVHIFRGTLKEALFINLTENIQREDPNAVELGSVFAELVDSHGMLQTDLAQQLGKSPAYVSMILKFHRNDNISVKLREMVKANQIHVWMALEIAAKPIEQQTQITERLADAFAAGKGPEHVKRIQAEMNKDKAPRKRKLRSRKEVQERFDKFLISDLNGLSEEEQAHVSGIMKTMYWMLNNDVEWDEMGLLAWGLHEEAIEEAQMREGKRLKKIKKESEGE